MTSEDSVKFKAYMQSDKDTFKMSFPSHVTYYDRNFEFMKDRSFWLSMTLGLVGLMYAKNKYECEKARMVRWERM